MIHHPSDKFGLLYECPWWQPDNVRCIGHYRPPTSGRMNIGYCICRNWNDYPYDDFMLVELDMQDVLLMEEHAGYPKTPSRLWINSQYGKWPIGLIRVFEGGLDCNANHEA